MRRVLCSWPTPASEKLNINFLRKKLNFNFSRIRPALLHLSPHCHPPLCSHNTTVTQLPYVVFGRDENVIAQYFQNNMYSEFAAFYRVLGSNVPILTSHNFRPMLGFLKTIFRLKAVRCKFLFSNLWEKQMSCSNAMGTAVIFTLVRKHSDAIRAKMKELFSNSMKRQAVEPYIFPNTKKSRCVLWTSERHELAAIRKKFRTLFGRSTPKLTADR